MDFLTDTLGYPAANTLVPVLLFILLSPGYMLTVTPSGLIPNVQVNFPPRLDSTLLFHALVFFGIFHLLRTNFPQFY